MSYAHEAYAKAQQFRHVTGHDKTTTTIVFHRGGCLSTLEYRGGAMVLNDYFVLLIHA